MDPQLGKTSDESFHFHPRASNPELWRTSVPLIVYERCNGHKGLIAAWTAIHWLIVLYAASGRRAFGMREIAGRARVGRNELAGPRGYIQRLVNLSLLGIVGYERVPGLAEPRPIYHIDLWELERQSLALIPEVLRAQGVPAPPRPAPDQRQISFFDALEALPAAGTGTGGACPEIGTAQSPMSTTCPETGTGGQPYEPLRERNGTGLPENGTGVHSSKPLQLQIGTGLPENGTEPPVLVTELSRNRDVERKKEREKEREREIALAQDSLSEIAAQAAQAVIALLRQQGAIPMQSEQVVPDVPTAPEGQPVLPATPFALWQGDRTALSARDRHQLAILASEIDAPTGGYGAYWVGRAILIADRCLTERGQPMNLNYLRGMLRRWQRESSWGSDLEIEREPAPARSSRATDLTAATLAPDEERQPSGVALHPAVVRYIATFGQQPNPVQSQQISELVTDFTAWEQVLTDWQAHNWRADSVPKMLDRYNALIQTQAPKKISSRSENLMEIYRYPGIEDEERQRWMYRFTHAEPSEGEVIMAQFRKKYSQQ